MFPSAKLTVFHVPQFDAVTTLLGPSVGGKGTFVGNGDPVTVNATTCLGESEVAHGWEHGLVEGEVSIETLCLEATVKKDFNVGVKSFPQDFDVLVGVGRYVGFFKALGDLLRFFAIHAPTLIQVKE